MKYIRSDHFNTKSGVIFLFVLTSSLIFTYLAVKTNLQLGMMFIGVLLALPLLTLFLFNIKAGVYIVLTYSFFILGILRFVNIPLGVSIDIMIFILFFGILIDSLGKKTINSFNNPISLLIIIWLIYNLLQALNPASVSRIAWFYTIRGMAGLFLIYFIILYAFNDLKSVKTLIKLWFFLALIAAFYGLFQEFHGLLDIEKSWVLADEERTKLIYNWGRFRKFSFFSDPTNFGILMAYTGLFCISLALGPFDLPKKILFAFMGMVMWLAMVYTGTRTAYAMIPAGVFFYGVITLNKKSVIITTSFFAIGIAIIFSPISSIGVIDPNSLNRIRSAFDVSNDASFQVRQVNQQFIQPFIQSHPFGAGLGSVGVWGRKFSPDSPLSKFPPDSMYVRIAVEVGWVGLILYCALLFTILKTGIKNYYKIKDPEIKAYHLGLLIVLFSLSVANYPQQAISLFPTIFIFFIASALLVKLRTVDETSFKPNSNP